MNIHERHMILGPISFMVLAFYAIIFTIIHKMNYKGKFEWKFLPLYPFVIIFAIVDLIYNITIGTLLFLELPKELLFTSRLKRHKNGPDGDNKDFAIYVCSKLMDRYDPGHC
jgi:hypothetical protein